MYNHFYFGFPSFDLVHLQQLPQFDWISCTKYVWCIVPSKLLHVHINWFCLWKHQVR
jgi:hypothetical protein